MWKWAKTIYCKLLVVLSRELDHDQEEFRQKVIIESLNPNSFENYNINKASITNMSVIYSDIVVYCKKIDFCTMHLKEHNTINNSWCSYEFVDSDLMSFLMDKGKYIKEPQQLAIFKEKMLFFHDLIYTLNQSDNLTDEHNLRIVRRFYNHCIDIIETLNRFS